MELFIKLISLICVSSSFSSVIYGPIVTIDSGTVQGLITHTRNNRPINAFLSIPYAEAPIGDLRFKNPVPKKPWNSIFPVNESFISCPKWKNKLLGQEDCLRLNVYFPERPLYRRSTLLPVMVYFNGEGFVQGDVFPFNDGPDYLLDRDVILVTVNYRLGILGFLSTGDQAAPGNFGLKDQLFALRWIQRNIKLFEGDPNRVTLLGFDTGAICVHLLTLLDESKGLFHQYILHSGTMLSPLGFRNSTTYPRHANKVAETISCSKNDTEIMMACLRNASLEKLIVEPNKIFTPIEILAMKTWGPTLEADFLPEYPNKIFAKTPVRNIPFILGVVTNEGTAFVSKISTNEQDYKIVEENFDELIELSLESYNVPKHNHALKDMIMRKYFQDVQDIWSNKTLVLQQLEKFYSDSTYFYPSIKVLERERRLSTAPFYFFNFNYRGFRGHKNLDGFGERWIVHGDDILYLFPKSIFKMINSNFEDKDEGMIDAMLDLWTSFVVKGIPESSNLTSPWPTYSPDRTFLRIGQVWNNNIDTDINFFKQRMNFWKGTAL